MSQQKQPETVIAQEAAIEPEAPAVIASGALSVMAPVIAVAAKAPFQR
tara:strand:- start:1290 stop:1433 length:144 start_codon:yes stop_codon:yes gene_type:complete